MSRQSRVQYFESEGRHNLPQVIRCIKAFLRDRDAQSLPTPQKLIFLTREGEGPLLAYNQFQASDLAIIAVTFPIHYVGTINQHPYSPEIPDKLRKFFEGVGIRIVTNRLPFDPILGADSHNREMSLIVDAFTIFGGSVPLAIQAVLQATDAGLVRVGESVIAATGDTALLVTASSTRLFLKRAEYGLAVNEIICKPKTLDIAKKPTTHELQKALNAPQLERAIEPKQSHPDRDKDREK